MQAIGLLKGWLMRGNRWSSRRPVSPSGSQRAPLDVVGPQEYRHALGEVYRVDLSELPQVAEDLSRYIPSKTSAATSRNDCRASRRDAAAATGLSTVRKADISPAMVRQKSPQGTTW